LTAGQMAGIGATVGGAGLLASRLKRRKWHEYYQNTN
jgi:hypothetical protein